MRTNSIMGLAVVLCLAGIAQADVTTLATDADSYVASYYLDAGKNFGTNNLLNLHREGGPNNYTFVHFDLSSFVGTVNSATLNLTRQGSDGNYAVLAFAVMDESYDVYRSQTEASINYNNTSCIDKTNESLTYARFYAEGTDASSGIRQIGTGTGNNNFSADVTELVQYILGQNSTFSTHADTDDMVTIAFRLNGWCYDVDYYSRDYTSGDDSDAPRLEIDFTPVPEPATLILMMGATLPLLLRRRRTA